MGQPSQSGPRSDQDERFESPSRMKAPLLVPTRSIVRVTGVPPLESGLVECSDRSRDGFSSVPDPAASVAGFEWVDDPAIRRYDVMVRRAGNHRVARLVMEDRGHRQATGVADPL